MVSLPALAVGWNPCALDPVSIPRQNVTNRVPVSPWVQQSLKTMTDAKSQDKENLAKIMISALPCHTTAAAQGNQTPNQYLTANPPSQSQALLGPQLWAVQTRRGELGKDNNKKSCSDSPRHSHSSQPNQGFLDSWTQVFVGPELWAKSLTRRTWQRDLNVQAHDGPATARH
jgi:hypothetical protein